jgi:signal transduction histidine kinase
MNRFESQFYLDDRHSPGSIQHLHPPKSDSKFRGLRSHYVQKLPKTKVVKNDVQTYYHPDGLGTDFAKTELLQNSDFLFFNIYEQLAEQIGALMNEKPAAEAFVRSLVPAFSDWCLIAIYQDSKLKPAAFSRGSSSGPCRIDSFEEEYFNVEQHFDSHSLGQFQNWGENSSFGSLRSSSEFLDNLNYIQASSYFIAPLENQGTLLGVAYFGFSESISAERQASYLHFANKACLLLCLSLTRSKIHELSLITMRAREAVLAMVAHDIKGPISTMLLALEMIELAVGNGPAGVASIAKYSRLSHLAGDRGLRLVQDLLDFDKLQNGNFSLDRGPFRASDLILAVLDQFQFQVVEKNIHVDRDLKAGAVEVKWDRDRLMQAFGNILGNALKFTPEGGQVRIEIVDRGTSLEISFLDSGPGISASKLDHAFQKFWQNRETASLGNGLGLSIAQGIISAHGGRVWAECPVPARGVVRCLLPKVASIEAL